MISFELESMQTQYNVLGYRIDLYFHDCKLPVENDENGHSGRNIDQKINKQKQNVFRAINEIFRHIKNQLKEF